MPLLSILVAYAFQATLDSDTKKLFDWYESFHVSEYLKKPFVHIEGGPIERRNHYGFLIEDKANEATVLTTSLAIIHLDKTVSRRYNFRDVKIAPANVTETLKSNTRFLLAKDEERDYQSVYLGSPYSTVAWLCSKFGLEDDVKQLIKLDKSWGSTFDTHDGGYVGRAKYFAMKPIEHEAVLDIEDMSLSWADLQQRFEALNARYTDCPQSEELGQLIKMTKGLAEDEKNHRPGSDEVGELIWGLPYEKVEFGIWNSTLVKKLEQIGLAAIPQLENALSDERLTRSMWHPTSGPPVSHDLHTICRVKDVARRAIEEIAHQRFEGQTPEEIRANVDKWYQSVLAGGEAATIVSNVKKGGYNAAEGAETLVKKYPDVALDAIVAGIKASDADSRASLVKTLAGLKRDEVNRFLLEVAKTEKEFEPRVAAITILADRLPKQGIPLAISEWQNVKEEPSGFGLMNLISILLVSDQTECIKALQKDLRKRPVVVREMVIGGYQQASMTQMFNSGSYSEPVLTEDAKAAIEDLMASELDDNEVWNGFMGSGGIELTSPQMSTIALFELSQFLPGIYTYKDTKSEADLAAQKKEAIKIHGLRAKARGG